MFQDYDLISKKIKIFVLRNIKQIDESKKNILARFISFIDVLYENKNILSISSNVELDEIYIGNTNFSEFKRTISRLKEMGTNKYINKKFNYKLVKLMKSLHQNFKDIEDEINFLKRKIMPLFFLIFIKMKIYKI